MKVTFSWFPNKECKIKTHRAAELALKEYFLITLTLNLKHSASGLTGRMKMTRKFDNMSGSVIISWKVPFHVKKIDSL